jgi:hypothetical protein
MTQPAPQPPPENQPAGADDRAHRPPDDSEQVYYQGSPRLRGELGLLLVWALIGIILIALPFLYSWFSNNHTWPAWYVTLGLIVLGLICFSIPYIKTRTLRYRVSNYRIDCERGLLSRRIDTLELWHVEDIQFHQSLWDRILGVGDIKIVSHDDTTPQLTLRGVPNPRPLFESLKQRIIAVKRSRGVIKMDTGG